MFVDFTGGPVSSTFSQNMFIGPNDINFAQPRSNLLFQKDLWPMGDNPRPNFAEKMANATHFFPQIAIQFGRLYGIV